MDDPKRPAPPSPFVGFRGRELRLPKVQDPEGTSAHPVGAAEAWGLFEPQLRKTGVTRISDVTHLDRIGIPVFNVLRPSLNGFSVAHGKGFTPTAARLSAAGESLERWYGTRTELPSFRSTWNDLSRTYPMVPPERLATTPHGFFHRDLEIPWTLGWDLARQEEVPVPLELVHLSPGGSDRSLADLSEGLLFQCSSNGLACGVHLLEALTQALLEVIERDSVTTCTMAARAQGLPAPCLRAARPETLPFPRVRELLDRIGEEGIEVLLADNGTDVGIPTWNCFLLDLKEPHSLASSAHGMGSALDQETAMIRAITEAVQGRCVFLSGVRDIVPSKEFQRSLRGNAATSLRVTRGGVREWLDLSALEDRPFPTFEEDLRFCLERLASVGLDRVLAFQLSRDEDPVQAVKVLVPGAEGYIFPYYQPGERALGGMRHGMEEGSPLFRKEGFPW